jgi:hypothetical protein
LFNKLLALRGTEAARAAVIFSIVGQLVLPQRMILSPQFQQNGSSALFSISAGEPPLILKA